MSNNTTASNTVDNHNNSKSKIKKTLTESRRAEQNRAAQRAFRQRKERYVKELEAKVTSMADWPARMERLEKENEQLKRYIIELEQQVEKQNMNKLFTRPTTTTPPATEKTKALDTLDDLMSILKTHHRPPIPSHPPPPS
ncbi:Putative BZIP transcription factor [Rhizopus microsporus]|nr:Putative BZIP transcription factor [Rhizopus microsporus]CEI95754.1 Putative BZIP transcription factor [Rhizopus microsporus]